jgi:hypothetical protein
LALIISAGSAVGHMIYIRIVLELSWAFYTSISVLSGKVSSPLAKLQKQKQSQVWLQNTKPQNLKHRWSFSSFRKVVI